HCTATGEIGSFRIVSESSISAGNRRIEAITGPRAVEYTQREHHLLRQISSDLRVAPDEVPERINRLADQIRQLERENRELRQKLLRGETQVATGAVEEINGIKVLIREMPDLPSDELQTAMDAMMENASNQVAVLA